VGITLSHVSAARGQWAATPSRACVPWGVWVLCDAAKVGTLRNQQYKRARHVGSILRRQQPPLFTRPAVAGSSLQSSGPTNRRKVYRQVPTCACMWPRTTRNAATRTSIPSSAMRVRRKTTPPSALVRRRGAAERTGFVRKAPCRGPALCRSAPSATRPRGMRASWRAFAVLWSASAVCLNECPPRRLRRDRQRRFGGCTSRRPRRLRRCVLRALHGG